MPGQTPDGDFVLSPTGYGCNVRRSLGDGSALSIAAGQRKQAVALASIMSLAETEKTDAWERSGPDLLDLPAALQRG